MKKIFAVKKVIRNVLATILLAIGMVVLLAWLALGPNSQKPSFNRQFSVSVKPGKPSHVIKKSEYLSNISGMTSKTLYFQDFKTNTLLATDYNLQILDTLSFQVPADKGYQELVVDSPQVWVFEKSSAIVTKTDINTKKEIKYKFYNFPFTRIALISPTSFVFRGIDTTGNKVDQRLFKTSLWSKSWSREDKIFGKNNDGGISTDGLLKYDTVTHRLLYVPFYSNEIICMDTSFNLVYKVNTIDRNTKSTMKAGQVDTGNAKSKSFTNFSPVVFINKSFCVNNGYLYNCSGSKADNEDNAVFANNLVIDVYNIQNGKYLESFYVPKYKGEDVFAFQVTGDSIVVLYANYMAVYGLEGFRK